MKREESKPCVGALCLSVFAKPPQPISRCLEVAPKSAVPGRLLPCLCTCIIGPCNEKTCLVHVGTSWREALEVSCARVVTSHSFLWLLPSSPASSAKEIPPTIPDSMFFRTRRIDNSRTTHQDHNGHRGKNRSCIGLQLLASCIGMTEHQYLTA
jgi:hypothetical protein